MQQQSGYEAAQ